MNNNEKIALSVAEAASALGVCKAQVYRYAAEAPAFPAVRVGEKRLIVPRQALEQWLANRVSERKEG